MSISRRQAITGLAALSAIVPVSALAEPRAIGHDGEGSRLNCCSRPIYVLNRRGVSRQFTTFDARTKIKAVLIRPGEKRTLVNYDGSGIITRMWMTISGWFWEYWGPQDSTDPTILKKLILRIYWDGNDYPSVEAPIGDFFGIGQCEYKQYLSQYIGMSSGGFYSYFPMPFSRGVRIEAENMHDKIDCSVFLNANCQIVEGLPDEAGRFQCLYNSGTNPGSEPLTILKASGKGHYVGCCISMQGKEKDYLSFLEAPEYFYIDTEDRSSPTLVGTGMEDYFNGGWYFRDGEFTGPYHGVPIKDPLRSMITMYRFQDQDAVCFNKSIELSFVNPRPARRLRPFKFSSTAYWYQDKASKLAFTLPAKDDLVNWYRFRDTDHLSIP